MDASYQGNLGLSDAIRWFTANKYTVSIPLTDTQYYDILVEKNHKVEKIQVKTTKSKKKEKDKEYYRVHLCKKDKLSEYLDYVYILTSDDTRYLIPIKELADKKTRLTLYPKYDIFKIENTISFDF